MKTFLLFFLFSLQAFSGPFFSINNEKNLNEYIQDIGFSGSILVKNESGVLLKEAFGKRKVNEDGLIQPDDIFQIGSITKQFVAASVLKLTEEKKLSLEDHVTTYLPELTQLSEVTIKDLLNQTSGLTNYTETKEFGPFFMSLGTASFDDIYGFVSKLGLDFAPRTNYNYSNSGTIIVAKIIQKVSGQFWFDYLKETFLKKLGMNSTTAEPDISKVSAVRGHIGGKVYDAFDYSWAQSAGMIQSNTEDLLKWSSLYEANSLLSPDSMRLMQTPFRHNYALGVVVEPYQNDTLIWHNGQVPGFHSELAYVIGKKLTVITLDNITTGPAVRNALLDYYFAGKAQVLKFREISLDRSTLENYVGDYSSTAGTTQFTFTVENDKLILTTPGQPAYILKAVDTDSFNLEDVAGEEFFRDSNSQVIGLRHYQNGRIEEFKKIR